MAGLPSLPSLDPTLAREERRALAATAVEVGEDAATLCEGWDVKDLVCHLLVRERSPLGAPGIAVSALSGLTDREMARLGRQPFTALVDRLLSTRLTFFSLGPVDALVNTLEFFIHHEDIRRAQEGWRRRTLSDGSNAALWKALRVQGGSLVRAAGVPVVARRTDTDETITLSDGAEPVVLTGPVSEILLYLFGREQVRDLSVTGPPEKVARMHRADLGF